MTFLRDGDNRSQRAAVDAQGHVSTVDMGIIHTKIHAGEMFASGSYFTAVADAAAVTLLIRVGSVPMHGHFTVANGGSGFLEAFEGVTVTAPGTTVPIYNRKRNSANAPTSTVFHTPTLGATGTTLIKAFTPGGSKTFASGAISSDFDEMVLLANTDYALRWTNQSGAAEDASLAINFYELNIG